MSDWLLSVPTLFGLESLAAREVRDLGYATERVEDGRVTFRGDDMAICRSNLWLRVGERVQIKMGDFSAVTFDELFERTKALPWPALLPADAAFPVNGHSLSSKLHSVPDCQAILKKAIVEAMKRKVRVERLPETGALYRVHFNLIRDRVTLYVDTSGEGLHKRGYRADSTLAPIRETLAAALVKLSGWRPGTGLWDPFCGSGTLVIEAALIEANRAPGLFRRFAAEDWGLPDKALWAAAREEARSLARDLARGGGADGPAAGNGSGESRMLVGSDLERRAVTIARQNAKKAGVSELVRFFQMDAKDTRPDHERFRELDIAFPERGSIVANPPYGERLIEVEDAREACRAWGKEALTAFRRWGWCVISAHEDFESLIGRGAAKRRKLYNGMLKCTAFIYKPELLERQ
ncbi:MAG: class I SAM-dependent RNA methyltransferase [Clostridiales bacterium]|jgi:putative N6-adenine-specific DNA methylase|nr:class I SAM-dependent RNA methyltransferase [Clostridiales bacterium]